MDNGAEIIAKLPNPCAGPLFYITASEVAARKFVSVYLELKNRISDYNIVSFVMCWTFPTPVYFLGPLIETTRLGRNTFSRRRP
jgi:hypothetical protein